MANNSKLHARIQACPHGISLDLCDWLDETFQWQKSIPGRGEENAERYLQMSGWQDVKDLLRAVAMAQARGDFKRDRTGLENSGILSRVRSGGNPIIEKMMEARR